MWKDACTPDCNQGNANKNNEIHSTSIRMPKIPKIDNTNPGDDVEQQEISFIAIAGEMHMGTAIWKTVWQFPVKL